MASSISWLDTSPEEQRRMREVLRLFEQHESRDELGVGQVRDVLSDALFPGFSVLHTRARYHLFIPWCFQTAARSRASDDLAVRAARQERILAATLASTIPQLNGVIGARTGAAVKTLPSAMYWNGLRTFGVLARDAAPTGLTGAVVQPTEADELAGRVIGDWHPTLPACPPGFPKEVDGGFDLTHHEAAWLRERMIGGAHGALLGQLLQADRPPEGDSGTPWTDPVVSSVATGAAAEALDHAHAFSVVMHGATLVYLLIVADAYATAPWSDDDFSLEPYRQGFEWWADAVTQDRDVLDGWDVDVFWHFVRGRNPRISPLTERFVRAWVGMVRSGSIAEVLDDTSEVAGKARRLIEQRERHLKGRQSRLVNQRLLQTWGPAFLGRKQPGESPSAALRASLTYRWPNVRTIVRDVFDGLERGTAGDTHHV